MYMAVDYSPISVIFQLTPCYMFSRRHTEDQSNLSDAAPRLDNLHLTCLFYMRRTGENIMDVWLTILRIVHIIGGIIWVGFGIFLTFILLPALRHPGEEGLRLYADLQLTRLMPIASSLTTVAGVLLYLPPLSVTYHWHGGRYHTCDRIYCRTLGVWAWYRSRDRD